MSVLEFEEWSGPSLVLYTKEKKCVNWAGSVGKE